MLLVFSKYRILFQFSSVAFILSRLEKLLAIIFSHGIILTKSIRVSLRLLKNISKVQNTICERSSLHFSWLLQFQSCDSQNTHAASKALRLVSRESPVSQWWAFLDIGNNAVLSGDTYACFSVVFDSTWGNTILATSNGIKYRVFRPN